MADNEVAEYQRPADTKLEQFARDLQQTYNAARQLVTTSFVPASYKGRPEEAAAAILTGAEIGLSPMAALRSIDIINGVPAMRAVTLRALVQSHGHTIWVEESTATQAIVKGIRKGSDHVETSLWTIARAQNLALTGKDNWKKQPIAMLLARATSELCRLIDADGILGIAYSAEEIRDDDSAVQEMTVVTDAPRQSARRTAKRKPLEQKPTTQPEEPPLDTDEQPEPEPVPDPQPKPEKHLAEVEQPAENLPKAAVPFLDDPMQPTEEELAEWGELPEEDR